MQNFTYHCHTNNFGVYDGLNTPDEMMSRAEELGFSEIGISNHLMCTPGFGPIDKFAAMHIRDYNQGEDFYKRTIEEIRTAALKHKIKVWVGFEVDYFHNREWERHFERLMKVLDADYYIGSTHFLYNNDFTKVNKISYFRRHPELVDKETAEFGLQNHWKNIIGAINSGYFDFIAHLDQIKSKGFCLEPEWKDWQWKVIEALAARHQPYELSTKGLRAVSEMYPAEWMVKELSLRKVPVVISDDAHSVEQLGENFAVAEQLLSSLKYTERFKMLQSSQSESKNAV